MGMVNRIETAVVRSSVVGRETASIVVAATRSGYGAVYHPTDGQVVAFNFGSRIRPRVAPIRVTSAGDETVESFLARGGRIVTCKPSSRQRKALTLNPYDVRKTPSAGSISTRRQKFEPAFLLR